jgi:hypothetical protein
MMHQIDELTKLEIELVVGAMKNTLTEERYNEILDILLPTILNSPDTQATLIVCGKQEWQERRFQRLKATKSAA